MDSTKENAIHTKANDGMPLRKVNSILPTWFKMNTSMQKGPQRTLFHGDSNYLQLAGIYCDGIVPVQAQFTEPPA